VLAEPAGQQVEAVHGAGQRLDEGGVVERQIVREQVAVGDRRHGVLRGGARRGHADGVPPLAEVAPPDRAVVAFAAEQGRVDRDPVALGHLGDLGADGDHRAGELVAGG